MDFNFKMVYSDTAPDEGLLGSIYNNRCKREIIVFITLNEIGQNLSITYQCPDEVEVRCHFTSTQLLLSYTITLLFVTKRIDRE